MSDHTPLHPHNPFPKTPAEKEEVIKGYQKQIAHFEERIAETRQEIRRLQGQTTIYEVTP